MSSSIPIIAKNIRSLREGLGMSIKGFSEMGNISPATLVNIENGKKSFRLKSIERISEITNVSLEELFKENFSPAKNLREQLIKQYENDIEISVILSSPPTLQYTIKQVVLPTQLLRSSKEINEIKEFLSIRGFNHKGNSI
ncbi:MAG: XRE family transcriptional regulator, partial [Chitinophagaceae bacterium]